MGETIVVNKKSAVLAYRKGEPAVKAVLKELFGKDLEIDLKAWVRNFNDVCEMAGVDPQAYDVRSCQSSKASEQICLEKLMLIERVFNNGDAIDLLDVEKLRYYPWHRIILDANEPWGFRLSYFGCVYVRVAAFLGARPFFYDSDDAVFVGKTFVAEYAEWLYYMNLNRKQS